MINPKVFQQLNVNNTKVSRTMWSWCCWMFLFYSVVFLSNNKWSNAKKEVFIIIFQFLVIEGISYLAIRWFWFGLNCMLFNIHKLSYKEGFNLANTYLKLTWHISRSFRFFSNGRFLFPYNYHKNLILHLCFLQFLFISVLISRWKSLALILLVSYLIVLVLLLSWTRISNFRLKVKSAMVKILGGFPDANSGFCDRLTKKLFSALGTIVPFAL